MYFSVPFIVNGPLQVVPRSVDVNRTTPGSNVLRNATKISPVVATLIWGSYCHPTPLHARPHTNVCGLHVAPPSVERRKRMLVPGQRGEHSRALIPVMSW